MENYLWIILYTPLVWSSADHVDPGRNEGSVLGFTGQAFDADWLLRVCAVCRYTFMSHLIKIYAVLAIFVSGT